MTGQDAVGVAKTFDERLGVSGFIMTKLDGDARGGAALSIRAVTGKPIKFIGIGEKLDALELFHPERMASRILGMGDVVSLVEKAQELFDEKEAKELEKKIRKDEFTLEDFKDQLKQIKKLGSMESLLGMIPGALQVQGGHRLFRGRKGDQEDRGYHQLDDAPGKTFASSSGWLKKGADRKGERNPCSGYQ